jgi:hypothetical protein
MARSVDEHVNRTRLSDRRAGGPAFMAMCTSRSSSKPSRPQSSDAALRVSAGEYSVNSASLFGMADKQRSTGVLHGARAVQPCMLPDTRARRHAGQEKSGEQRAVRSKVLHALLRPRHIGDDEASIRATSKPVG